MTLSSNMTEMELFIGTGEWREDIMTSSRPGFRCVVKEDQKNNTTLRAYFDDGGRLALMVATVGETLVELPASVLTGMAAQVIGTPGIPTR